MEIVERKITDLIFAEYNPRQMTKDQAKALTDSIKRFGLVDPIIVNKHKDRENIVVGGHQRLRIAAELGIDKVPVVYVDLPEARERELNIRLNQNSGEWDYDALANFFDVDDLLDWGFTEDELQFFETETEPEEIIAENIDKDIGDIKILNLYAGIGGNRKLWGDLDITAVEYNEEIAKVYQDYFPNDKVIVEDAHKYLEEHFSEFDFIWASPPCPTHSRIRKWGVDSLNYKPIYPDMKLYEEIIFLQGYFKGKYVIENVISWYDPLIEPCKIGRHYYWTNFNIDIEIANELAGEETIPKYQDESIDKSKWGFDLNKYKFDSDYPAQKILNNMVHPKTGEYILKCAYGDKTNA